MSNVEDEVRNRTEGRSPNNVTPNDTPMSSEEIQAAREAADGRSPNSRSPVDISGDAAAKDANQTSAGTDTEQTFGEANRAINASNAETSAGTDTEQTFGEANRAINASNAETDDEPSESQVEEASNQSDIFTGAVAMFESATGADVPGDGSVVNVAREEDEAANGEQFGDIEVRLPELSEPAETGVQAVTNAVPGASAAGDILTENQGERVETVLDEEAQEFNENVTQPAADIAGDVAALIGTGAEVATRSSPLAAGGTILNPQGAAAGSSQGNVREEGVAEATDITAAPEQETGGGGAYESFGEGVGEGATGVLNTAALANMGKEGAEFVGYGAGEVAEGEGGEFAAEAGGAAALAAAQTTRAAERNPAGFAGQLAGGAVTSAIALRGLSAAGATRTANAIGAPARSTVRVLRRSDTDSDAGAPGIPDRMDDIRDEPVQTLTPDMVDEARGVSGPSTRSRLAGQFERSPVSSALDEVRTATRQLRDDDRAMVSAGQQRRRRPDTDDSGQPDAPTDYEPSRSEVLKGSTRDQFSDAVADRTLRQRRQFSQDVEDRSDAFSPATRETRDLRDRMDRARRREARVDDTGPSGGVGVGGPLAGGVLGSDQASAVDDVGLVDQPTDRLSEVERPTATTGDRGASRKDVGAPSVFGSDKKVGGGGLNFDAWSKGTTKTFTDRRFDTDLDTFTGTDDDSTTTTTTTSPPTSQPPQPPTTSPPPKDPDDTSTPTMPPGDTTTRTPFDVPRDNEEGDFYTEEQRRRFESVRFENPIADASDLIGL